jgi:hypothetical protein
MLGIHVVTHIFVGSRIDGQIEDEANSPRLGSKGQIELHSRIEYRTKLVIVEWADFVVLLYLSWFPVYTRKQSLI